jgi:Fe-S-cluster containining protein
MQRRLDELYVKVDSFFRKAATRQPRAMVCRPGCADCCKIDISVFEVEAHRIREAISRLPVPLRAQAARRAAEGDHCALLDPKEDTCLIYESRPLICRTHGLSVLTAESREGGEGRPSHCPLNYVAEPPEPDCVLSLDTTNAILAVISELAGDEGRRVRIARIAEMAERSSR